MKKHYFTFGFGQPHENGYHVVTAQDRDQARAEMFRRFGQKWSFQYDSADAAGVDRFHLHEVKFREATRTKRVLRWLFDNAPLGRFAPYVLGLILGRRPKTKYGKYIK